MQFPLSVLISAPKEVSAPPVLANVPSELIQRLTQIAMYPPNAPTRTNFTIKSPKLAKTVLPHVRNVKLHPISALHVRPGNICIMVNAKFHVEMVTMQIK